MCSRLENLLRSILICSILMILICSLITDSKSIQWPTSFSCEKILPASQLQIDDCLNKSKILYKKDFLCYDINDQGPCNDGKILVLDPAGRCGETECILNPNDCNEGKVRYQGGCIHPFDPLGCGRDGTRVHQNAFGEIVCECASYLGFIHVNGSCYHEYLQGPCEDDEQLIKNGVGYNCTQNVCGEKGEIRWRDNKCYPIVHSASSCNERLMLVNENASKTRKSGALNETPNLVIRCDPFNTRNTIDNCHHYSSENICLYETTPPVIDINAAKIESAFCKLDFYRSKGVCSNK